MDQYLSAQRSGGSITTLHGEHHIQLVQVLDFALLSRADSLNLWRTNFCL